MTTRKVLEFALTAQKSRRLANNPVGAQISFLRLCLLIFHHPNKRQIAIQLVQIQAIPKYKLVGNVKAHIVEGHIYFDWLTFRSSVSVGV